MPFRDFIPEDRFKIARGDFAKIDDLPPFVSFHEIGPRRHLKEYTGRRPGAGRLV